MSIASTEQKDGAVAAATLSTSAQAPDPDYGRELAVQEKTSSFPGRIRYDRETLLFLFSVMLCLVGLVEMYSVARALSGGLTVPQQNIVLESATMVLASLAAVVVLVGGVTAWAIALRPHSMTRFLARHHSTAIVAAPVILTMLVFGATISGQSAEERERDDTSGLASLTAAAFACIIVLMIVLRVIYTL